MNPTIYYRFLWQGLPPRRWLRALGLHPNLGGGVGKRKKRGRIGPNGDSVGYRQSASPGTEPRVYEQTTQHPCVLFCLFIAVIARVPSGIVSFRVSVSLPPGRRAKGRCDSAADGSGESARDAEPAEGLEKEGPPDSLPKARSRTTSREESSWQQRRAAMDRKSVCPKEPRSCQCPRAELLSSSEQGWRR